MVECGGNSLRSSFHRGRVACDTVHVKWAIVIVILGLAVLLLGTTVKNEGCLPWQERVGYGDGTFGEGRDVSRCSGSWFPFGSAFLSLPQ